VKNARREQEQRVADTVRPSVNELGRSSPTLLTKPVALPCLPHVLIITGYTKNTQFARELLSFCSVGITVPKQRRPRAIADDRRTVQIKFIAPLAVILMPHITQEMMLRNKETGSFENLKIH
jgi:hypothetical protein